MSETEIITRYAARYVSEGPDGASMANCLATPGVGDVRLTVICTHPDGARFVYPTGPRGGLIQNNEGPDV